MPYDGKGARLMLIQKKAQQRNPLFSLPAKVAVISQTTWSKYSVPASETYQYNACFGVRG